MTFELQGLPDQRQQAKITTAAAALVGAVSEPSVGQAVDDDIQLHGLPGALQRVDHLHDLAALKAHRADVLYDLLKHHMHMCHGHGQM